MIKKKDNIIKFPNSISKVERKVEAILFAASEPLDIETIEKRLQSSTKHCSYNWTHCKYCILYEKNWSK